MINSYELHSCEASATHLRFIMPWCFCRICLLFLSGSLLAISYIEPLLSHLAAAILFCQKICLVYHLFVAFFQELLVLYDTRPSGWQLLLKNNLYHILVILFSENLLQPSPQTVPYRHEKINTGRFSAIFRNITTKNLSGGPGFFLDMNPQYFCRFFKTVSDDPDDLY